MVMNEDAGQGGGRDDDEREDAPLPEELDDLSEDELEEVVEMMGQQMTEEEGEALEAVMWLLCQIEAAGSMERARELGVLAGAPEEALAMVATMVPASRGGSATGEGVEQQWETFIDSMIAENGEDFFDKVRRQLGEE